MRVESSSFGRKTTAPSSSASPVSVMMTTTTTSSSNGNIADDNNNNNIINNPRSCILQVGVYAGRLCELANTHPAMVVATIPNNRPTTTGIMAMKESSSGILSSSPFTSTDHLVTTMADLFVSLWLTCRVLKLNMIVAIQGKLELNEKKYPVEHCKGKAGKYTQYSHLTGITKTNQVTNVAKDDSDNFSSSDTSSVRTVLSLSQVTQQIPQLSSTIADFAQDRLWTRYHTPRNLVMALLGEVGELSELLQFKGDADDDQDYDNPQKDERKSLDLVSSLERKELDKLSQELADVSIYLLRLATVCNVVSPLCEVLEGMAEVHDDV